MIEVHKNMRRRLKAATRKEYQDLIYAAKLTPNQVAVLKYHILQEKTVIETAMELNCCERKIANILKSAYEKLIKVQ